MNLSDIGPRQATRALRKARRGWFQRPDSRPLHTYLWNLIEKSAEVQRLTHLLVGQDPWIGRVVISPDNASGYLPSQHTIEIAERTLRQGTQQQLLDSGHELWHAQLKLINVVPEQAAIVGSKDYHIHEIAVESLALAGLKNHFGTAISMTVERGSLAYQKMHTDLCDRL